MNKFKLTFHQLYLCIFYSISKLGVLNTEDQSIKIKIFQKFNLTFIYTHLGTFFILLLREFSLKFIIFNVTHNFRWQNCLILTKTIISSWI